MFILDRKWNCGLVCDILPKNETRLSTPPCNVLLVAPRNFPYVMEILI